MLVFLLINPGTFLNSLLGLWTQDESEVSTRSISPELTEFFANEFNSAFWVENDYEKTYEIMKAKAEETKLRNSQSRNVSRADLADEMVAARNYAAIARLIDPKEGIDLYAEIYNNKSYDRSVRADALFEVMVYLNEKVGTELTVVDANEWIFNENTFGSVLFGTPLQGRADLNEIELKEAAIIGLKQAEEVNRSGKQALAFSALIQDVEAEILVLNNSATPADIDASVQAWLQKDQELSSSLLTAMNDRVTYSAFAPEFAHASKNMLRAYARLQGLGVDIADRFDEVYRAEMTYLAAFSDSDNISTKKHVDIQAGVASLFKACFDAYVGLYDADLEAVRDVLASDLTPFLSLSSEDRARFSAPAAVGEAGKGVCYNEYIFIGQLIPEFKQALIEDVGGWQVDQFDLSE